MAIITVKYSQPISTVSGEPVSIATNMALFKAQEAALMAALGGYTNKSSATSTTAGMILDWFLEKEIPEPEIPEPVQEIIEEIPDNENIRKIKTKSASPRAVISQNDPISQVVSAVSGSSAISGSGDPSDYLKTSLPQAVKKLIKHIINSWKSGYDMNAHNKAVQLHNQCMTLVSQLGALIPSALPDGISACTVGMNVYTQLLMIIQSSYLNLPNSITTADMQALQVQMSAINTQNEAFNSAISGIIICSWMKIPPALKLPTAYNNSKILIEVVTQLFCWLNGMTADNLGEIEDMLDTIQ